MSSGPAATGDKAASPDRTPVHRGSLRGLDGLNFLMADVRDGLGPFLSVFLMGSQHWSSGNIGIVMAASSLSAAVCQIPSGMLVDSLRAKRLLVARMPGRVIGISALKLKLASPRHASIAMPRELSADFSPGSA